MSVSSISARKESVKNSIANKLRSLGEKLGLVAEVTPVEVAPRTNEELVAEIKATQEQLVVVIAAYDRAQRAEREGLALAVACLEMRISILYNQLR